MASPFITRILSPSKFKIVDESIGFRQWAKLNIVEVDIESSANMADIPFATQNLTTQMQVDESMKADLAAGKIISPSRIRAKMLCDDISTVLGMITTFNNVTHQLKITSKEISSNHMSITGMRIRQSPEKLSAVEIEVVFEQSSPDVDGTFNPLQPGDQGSYGVHVEGSPGLLSSATALYNKVTNFIGF